MQIYSLLLQIRRLNLLMLFNNTYYISLTKIPIKIPLKEHEDGRHLKLILIFFRRRVLKIQICIFLFLQIAHPNQYFRRVNQYFRTLWYKIKKNWSINIFLLACQLQCTKFAHMGKEIVSWKCANCYFTECKWSANCSLQTIFMQIMPYHYIAVWSLHLHLMQFFLHPSDSPWTTGLGILLTFFFKAFYGDMKGWRMGKDLQAVIYHDLEGQKI